MQHTRAAIDQLLDGKRLAPCVVQDGWFKSTVMSHDMHWVAQGVASLLGDAVAGRAGQSIEPLMPMSQAVANAKSLSALHGLGSFPMHTDGAHLPEPPRFVVLVCTSPGASPVPTILFRFRDLQITASEHARLESAPFLVRNGRRSFYSTICSRFRSFIRFDSGCMVPQGADSEATAKLITHRANEIGFTAVHWRPGDILVIDNWNVLHGRGLGSFEASPDRQLLRVSVR